MVDGIRGPSQFDLPEFVSLQREVDPELRGEGLLSLAARLVREGRFELAAPIYDQLRQDHAFSASIRERACVRLAALRGQGDLGPRAELLLGHIVEQASDPSTLFAMTLAGFAFRATQFASLARLAVNPATSFTRGWGARALAGLAGFGVEATAFPLAARFAKAALGRESEWSLRSLGQETASSFLMLGALRAGGLITGSLASRSGLFRPLIQQAGMFGGIVLGHELEIQAGLRRRTPGWMALMDSLSTLLQFNVAGRISRGLFGEGLRRWELETETRGRNLGSEIPRELGPLPKTGLAIAGPASPDRGSWDILRPNLVMMAANNGEGPPRGGKVISMADYLDRIRSRPATPRPGGSEAKSEAPRRSLIEQFAPTYDPHFWLDQLQGSVMLWLSETPISPRTEYEALRHRLGRHPPELTILLGDLAQRRPMAAKLLAVRLDLLRENSWFRRSPEIRAAAEDSLASRYSVEQREEIYELGLQRFLMAIHMPEAAPRPIPSNLIQPSERLDALPVELAEAWRDPILTDQQFLTLTDYLNLFQP